jgi:hypothetical protein
MHPTFWAVYEVFLAHSLYDAGLRAGLSLRPATDHGPLINTQNAILDIPGYPSSGHVVEFDLQQVTLDLSHFELSELLQFREEHGAEYRRYARDLREFAMLVSQAKSKERRRLMQDRHDALADAADDLRRTSRDWWRRAAASIGIGLLELHGLPPVETGLRPSSPYSAVPLVQDRNQNWTTPSATCLVQKNRSLVDNSRRGSPCAPYPELV